MENFDYENDCGNKLERPLSDSHRGLSCGDKMMRGKAVSVIILFTACMGCSAQVVERSKEQEASLPKQEQYRKSSSPPTFTYRPGAGLMIEGR